MSPLLRSWLTSMISWYYVYHIKLLQEAFWKHQDGPAQLIKEHQASGRHTKMMKQNEMDEYFRLLIPFKKCLNENEFFWPTPAPHPHNTLDPSFFTRTHPLGAELMPEEEPNINSYRISVLKLLSSDPEVKANVVEFLDLFFFLHM